MVISEEHPSPHRRLSCQVQFQTVKASPVHTASPRKPLNLPPCLLPPPFPGGCNKVPAPSEYVEEEMEI